MIAAQIEHYFPGRRMAEMTPKLLFAYLDRIPDLIGDSKGRSERRMYRARGGRHG